MTLFRITPPRALFAAMLVVAASAAHAAEKPRVFSFEAKIHAGYAPNQGDHLDRKSLAYGVNFVWALPLGRLGAELGYQYKTGDSYAGAIQSAVPAGKEAVDYRNSVVEKRNDLSGFSLRVAYEGGFSLPFELTPRFGLMLGGTQFRQEYQGDVRSLNWGPGVATSWRDTFHGTPTKGGLNISPFLGVSLPITEGSALEVQLMWMGYTAIDYLHKPGTGTSYTEQTPTSGPLAPHNAFPQDQLATRKRFTPQLEIGWVFRF